MTFQSLPFLGFLALVLGIFAVVRNDLRWAVLLVASVVFYATLRASHLLLALLAVTALTYGVGLCLERGGRGRLALLWCGVLGDLAVLGLVKYLPLVNGRVRSMLIASVGSASPGRSFLFSVGVSYLVLQSISYLVDVYLESRPAERHLGLLALYLAFFPKLLQGPIERSDALIPQFRQPFEFKYDSARNGLLLFLWGAFKKMVVADRLGGFVNPLFDDAGPHSGLASLLAVYAFALQLYCDFSGYTDMAIGVARQFNIELTQNFDRPYGARSIKEFWRRWHVSFSRWLLDYVFTPLQVRFRAWRSLGTALAIFTTFSISGLWHGATWGFLVWGALHGFYLAASILFQPLHRKLGFKRYEASGIWRTLQVLATFHLVCFAWIFFRAPKIADAARIVKSIFAGSFAPRTVLVGQSRLAMLLTFTALGMVVAVESLKDRLPDASGRFFAQPRIVRWGLYTGLIWLTLFMLPPIQSPFIYVQF